MRTVESPSTIASCRRRRGARPAALAIALALAGGLALGCNAFPPAIAPDFAARRPELVRIAPVENKTLAPDLERYATSGVLQSIVFDRGEVDVLAAFFEGGKQGLVERRYPMEGDPRGIGKTPDGELRIRILSWSELSGPGGAGLRAEFDVALVRVPGDEELFRRRYVYSQNRSGPSEPPLTPQSLRRGVAGAVRGALSALPEWRPLAAESPPAPSAAP